MSVKWTETQKAVIVHPNTNLLVSASAGSGKTAVLIERVIKIITDEKNLVDITQILICTYTRKAASEMRDKLINRLSEMLNLDPRTKRLQKQLTLVQYADISTVHSFCQRLIRENFIKLGLTNNFAIKESNNPKMQAIKKQIVDQVLIHAYKDIDIQKKSLFIELVDNYGGEYTDSKIEDLIIKLHDFSRNMINPREWLEDQIKETKVLNSENIQDINLLKQYINQRWGLIYTEQVKQEIMGHIWNYENAIQIINSDHYFTNYKENFKVEFAFANELLNACKAIDLSLIYEIINNFEFSKLGPKKKGACERTSNYLKSVRDETKKTIKNLKETIFHNNIYDICNVIMKTSNSIAILCELVLHFDQLYTEKKRNLNLVDFEDLEHFTIDLLKDSNFTQDISSQYTYVLVDEYQDTSYTQSYIFDKIACKNNLFMVGDIKQSIYKFRNANPEIFLEKYNTYKTLDINDHHKTSDTMNTKLILSDNFRSDSRIVDFINHIFMSIMSSYVGEIDYSENEQLISSVNSSLTTISDKKNIELQLIQKIGTTNSEYNGYSNFEDPFELQSANKIEAKLVAQRIFKLVNIEKTQIYDKTLHQHRHIKYSDITILCRKTKEVSEILESELGKIGICVSKDSLSGHQSIKTNDIKILVNFLNIIDNPLQDISLLSVLRSPIFNFNERDFANIRINSKDKYFYNAILKFIELQNIMDNESLYDTYSKCKLFIETLERYMNVKSKITVSELIDRILSDTDFEIYLCTRENFQELQNSVDKLKDFAKKFESAEFRGLYQFLRHLEEINYSGKEFLFLENSSHNSDSDCISIMTIHKSKGLEFSVVFLFGCGHKFNVQDLNQNLLYDFNLGIAMNHIDSSKNIKVKTLSKSAIESKKRLEMLSEEMRLLYVALTRARDMLIISATVSDIEQSKKKWHGVCYQNKVLASYVSKQSNFIDWIGPAVFNKIQLNNINNLIDIYEYPNIDSTLMENQMVFLNVKADTSNIVDTEKLMPEYDYKTIKKLLSYEYKFKEATLIPAKLSASEILQLDFIDKKSINNLKVPNFSNSDNKRISPRFYGVLIHFIMQNIDFRFTDSADEIENQIDYMVEFGMLDPKYAKKVSSNKIFKFFKSDLGQRLKNANNMQREYRFFVEMLPSELGINRINKLCEEKIAIQGVIDCFFEEDDQIIIIDYKTGKKELHKLEYEKQLDIYTKALSKILDKPISETHIYEF